MGDTVCNITYDQLNVLEKEAENDTEKAKELTRLLFQMALDEVKNVAKGKSFYVKDLFIGHRWNRYPIGVRRNIGRDFFKESENPYLKNGTIVAVKDEKNAIKKQQLYRKDK